MFFVASKIYWLVASPVILLLIVAFAAVLTSAMRPSAAARAVALAAILLLMALPTTPIGLLMVAPLEDRFPEPPADMPPPDGIIVLGGAIKDAESRARGQIVFDEGERVVEAAILAKRYPNARVIFTGGNGSLFGRIDRLFPGPERGASAETGSEAHGSPAYSADGAPRR